MAWSVSGWESQEIIYEKKWILSSILNINLKVFLFPEYEMTKA